LPCDETGLPLTDLFLAASSDPTEECFKTREMFKMAYVYVAQSVSPAVPPFCLGCVRINNVFTATDVLKRWVYIYSECQKRSTRIISLGDSHLLRAMKISCQFKASPSDPSNLYATILLHLFMME